MINNINNINNDERLYPSRGVATLCGVGRNTMMRYLRKLHILNMHNIPTDKYRHDGWFKCRPGNFDAITTYWTHHGLMETKKVITDAFEKGDLKKPRKTTPVYKDEPPQGVVEFWGRIFE